jgi:hypothetical protein
MVSTTLVLATLASLAAAMPSTSGTQPPVQRRQDDPRYEQCVNTVERFVGPLPYGCDQIREPAQGSSCAFCCMPHDGMPPVALDTIEALNCHSAALPEEENRVDLCNREGGTGYICDPSSVQ